MRDRARQPGPTVVATVNDYAPGTLLRRHVHDRASLSIVVTGGQIERIGSRDRERGPLSVSFKRDGVEHANAIGRRSTRAVFVELARDVVDAVGEVVAVSSADDRGDPFARVLAARLALAARERGDGVREITFALLAHLGGPDASRDAPPPPWLARAREILADSFLRPPSLDDLAAAVGVHPVHLAQAFQRHYGHTTGAVIRHCRVARAIRALVATDAPLADIAGAVGFCDQSHMTRTFRRLVGVPPGAFRRRMRAP